MQKNHTLKEVKFWKKYIFKFEKFSNLEYVYTKKMFKFWTKKCSKLTKCFIVSKICRIENTNFEQEKKQKKQKDKNKS
jgi:hypothetical protein